MRKLAVTLFALLAIAAPLHGETELAHLVRALEALWSQCALSRAVA